MNNIAKLALVSILAAVSLGHGASPPASAASAPARYTGPLTVVRHDYTTAYKRVMTACMGDSSDWNRFEQCSQLHPDTGERCTRVEEWLDTTPQTFRVVRDEC